MIYTHQDIIDLRLQNQQIAVTQCDDPAGLLKRMGAIQAQDLEMAKLAIAMRLPGKTIDDIEKAIDKGELLRTHILRPTWHIVAAEDISWMLKLTAPRIKAKLKYRHKQLKITDGIVSKSKTVISDIMQKTDTVTRDDLIEGLKQHIPLDDKQAYVHLIMLAELDGILCNGRSDGKKHTYSLLEKRISKSDVYSQEKSLAALAKKYFTGHGPATLHDFTWWSGLPMQNARAAIEMNRSDMTMMEINSLEYWFYDTGNSTSGARNTLCLLPAYDEYIIAYTNRELLFTTPDMRKAISSNGYFRPVILIGGRAAGIWKMTTKKNETDITVETFQQVHSDFKEMLEQEVKRFENITGKKLNVALEV